VGRADLTTVDRLLTTTRSVRRRLDLSRPVEADVITRCLEIAVQAPTGSNIAAYHFVVVTEPALRRGLADLYRRVFFEDYLPYRREQRPDFPETDARFLASARYLAEQLHEVPVHVVPCVEGRVEDKGVAAQASRYGNILPAAWSFMLALRARGIGSAWTTLHLRAEREAGQLLGIPPTVTQAALIPVAYYSGEDFRPARRVPARDRTYWNHWGQTR
jgi:nitroreductase